MKNVTATILPIDRVLETSFDRPIGMCWGGFDFLHAGHILHFEFAKRLSRTLIVALNADDAFPDKGPGRPFLSEADRARVIASIAFVDVVTIYRGPYLDSELANGTIHGQACKTPYVPVDLIRRIRPEYYFKGFEYQEAMIPERALVEAAGGEVVCGPIEPVLSSSRLLRDLRPAAASSYLRTDRLPRPRD